MSFPVVYEFAMIVSEEVIFPCPPCPAIGWKLVSMALKYRKTVSEHDSPGDIRAEHTMSPLPIVTNDSTAHSRVPLNATWHVSSTLSLGHTASLLSVSRLEVRRTGDCAATRSTKATKAAIYPNVWHLCYNVNSSLES